MAVTLFDIYDTFPELDLGRDIAIGAVDPTTDTLTAAIPHELVLGQVVRFVNVGGALPTPLLAGTSYYVRAGFTSVDFQVSATFGGAAVNLTDSGSGSTTVQAINPAQDALVSAKLAEAQKRVDYTIFEDVENADSAVKYLTARLVALSPAGLNMKLAEKDGSTVYDREWRLLIQAAAFGFRVP